VGRREKLELANDAIAAAMPARAARSRSDFVALNPHWVEMLESFHRRVPAIGHVRVGCAQTIREGGRAHTARDGFVISERAPLRAGGPAIRSAERDVVHGAGAGGRNPLRCGLT